MVYRGKPSAACDVCRLKRRKCDRAHPRCSQCARARVPCPGYRDLLSLGVEDQTHEVIHKFKVAIAKKLHRPSHRHLKRDPKKSPQATSQPCSTSSSASPLPSPSRKSEPELQLSQDANVHLAVPYQLSLPLQHVAHTYFLSTFAASGQFRYLCDLVSADVMTPAVDLFKLPGTKAPSPLPHALLSCALATLSAIPAYSSPVIIPLAYKTYNAALESINVALSSPETSLLDSTLISVLLLGLFEALLFRGRASPTSWTAHTHGAFALLKMRGPTQFKTALGRELFLHAANNIRTSCMQHSLPPPTELTVLQAEAVANNWLDEEHDFGVHVGVRVGGLLEKIGLLRAEIRALSGSVPARSRITVTRALELDGEVQQLLRAYPDGWKPRIVRETRIDASSMDAGAASSTDQPPTTALLVPEYSWANPRAARSTVVLQMSRLVLNGWAGEALEATPRCSCDGNRNFVQVGDGTSHEDCLGGEEMEILHQLVFLHGRQAVREILAAVSYFKGSPARPQPKALARFLIWPLSVLAVAPFGVSEARPLAVRHLRDIGSNFGFEQAEQAARMVEDSRDIEDWLHIQHLS